MLGKKNDARKVLDVDASLQGNLVFKDAVYLNINGYFEGRLETKGDLTIGEGAHVQASIIGERITIAGEVKGDITALTELHLLGTARLSGNIESPTLLVDKGALFNGRSRMTQEEEGALLSAGQDGFFTVEEVARYLSVEKELISQWAEHGKLPADKDGSTWRFDKGRVDEWITNGRIA